MLFLIVAKQQSWQLIGHPPNDYTWYMSLPTLLSPQLIFKVIILISTAKRQSSYERWLEWKLPSRFGLDLFTSQRRLSVPVIPLPRQFLGVHIHSQIQMVPVIDPRISFVIIRAQTRRICVGGRKRFKNNFHDMIEGEITKAAI